MSIINAYELANFRVATSGVGAGVKGYGWVPCRPEIGTPLPWFWRERVREAWLVLTGHRHTVVYPGQETKP